MCILFLKWIKTARDLCGTPTPNLSFKMSKKRLVEYKFPKVY